jgi:FlgD Ig-like domain
LHLTILELIKKPDIPAGLFRHYSKNRLIFNRSGFRKIADFSFTVYCDNYLGSDSATIVVDVEAGNVSNDDDLIAATTALAGNYPNPFNPTTTINYNLTENENVTLKIYNVKSELVNTLVSQEQTAGNHSVVWNGTDNNGNQAGSSVYLYKMKTDKYSGCKSMIMLK